MTFFSSPFLMMRAVLLVTYIKYSASRGGNRGGTKADEEELLLGSCPLFFSLASASHCQFARSLSRSFSWDAHAARRGAKLQNYELNDTRAALALQRAAAEITKRVRTFYRVNKGELSGSWEFFSLEIKRISWFFIL